MGRIVDVSLENLSAAPPEVLDAVFWEVEGDDPSVDARFQKEEWFSSTMLEWGPCGKLSLDDEDLAVGFAEFAPPSLFPRLSRYRAGRCSPDAVYLAYCYVAPAHRGRGVGTNLVRAVAADLAGRGFGAVEALGERRWSGAWLLPAGFLTSNGFRVLRDDRTAPLLRLDLEAEPGRVASAARISLPAGPS